MRQRGLDVLQFFGDALEQPLVLRVAPLLEADLVYGVVLGRVPNEDPIPRRGHDRPADTILDARRRVAGRKPPVEDSARELLGGKVIDHALDCKCQLRRLLVIILAVQPSVTRPDGDQP